jgi:hypothetical protein
MMNEKTAPRPAPEKLLKCFPKFVSEEEAAVAAEKLRGLRDIWTPFGSDPEHPYMYYTGSAIYLSKSYELYQERRKFYDPKLEPVFSDLYQKLIGHFSNYFNCEVIKPAELAWPGFHVYHGTLMPNGGSIHWDRGQHMVVQKNFNEAVDVEEGYSFTLPVELTLGSGLRIWDIRFSEETVKQAQSGIKRDLASEAFSVEYQLGDLYLFNSNFLHQIAPNVNPVTEKRRMTVQGHLLRRLDGTMLMFW